MGEVDYSTLLMAPKFQRARDDGLKQVGANRRSAARQHLVPYLYEIG